VTKQVVVALKLCFVVRIQEDCSARNFLGLVVL